MAPFRRAPLCHRLSVRLKTRTHQREQWFLGRFASARLASSCEELRFSLSFFAFCILHVALLIGVNCRGSPVSSDVSD